MERLCFSISGEYLTNFVRDIMLSDYQKAFNILKQSIVDISDEDSIKILNGEAHFEGVNDLALIDFYDSNYKSQLNEIYSPLLKDKETLYKPYAIVDSLGIKDDIYAQKYTNINSLEEYMLKRAEYYVTKQGMIKPLKMNKGFILFERIDFPLNVETFSDVEEVYNNCKYLERAGAAYDAGNTVTYYSSLYPSKYFKEDIDDLESIYSYKKDEDKIDDRDPDTILEEGSIRRYTKRIIDQAINNGGFFGIRVKNKWHKVPYLAFMKWSFKDESELYDAFNWDSVCCSNLKINGDDPVHSDWILGAGFTLNEAYTEELERVYYDVRFKLTETYIYKKMELLNVCS